MYFSSYDPSHLKALTFGSSYRICNSHSAIILEGAMGTQKRRKNVSLIAKISAAQPMNSVHSPLLLEIKYAACNKRCV